MNIDSRLAAVESNLTSMNNYRLEFESKVSSLLANPDKFIPKNEFLPYLQEKQAFVDKRFENYKNIIGIFGDFYGEIVEKVDQVTEVTAILTNEISRLDAW